MFCHINRVSFGYSYKVVSKRDLMSGCIMSRSNLVFAQVYTHTL